MRNQAGYIFRIGKSWYGRWYRNEMVEGAVVRRQHSEKLVDYSDRYRRAKDVRPLLAKKLAPVNAQRCAESTLSVTKYAENYFFPHAESELKPSTVHGYKGLWRMYLGPRLGRVSLLDFTCGQATTVLADIHREHGLSRKSLRHCKGLLQTVFTHAKRSDVIAGENPVKDAAIPKRAVAANATHAYTVDEVMVMLNKLEGTAKQAIALMYFCGLRPGEARGIRWSDYDANKRVLHVQRSIWRKHETGPKTQESIAPVPVAEVLAEILSEAPPSSEYILATPSGRPVDLHNLAARAIVPVLERCEVCKKPKSKHAKAAHEFERDTSLPEWRGFYALRRGLATVATSMEKDPLAAKSLMRHSNMSTTMGHYIKSVPNEAIRAMDKINALFDNRSGSGRPN